MGEHFAIFHILNQSIFLVGYQAELFDVQFYFVYMRFTEKKIVLATEISLTTNVFPIHLSIKY